MWTRGGLVDKYLLTQVHADASNFVEDVSKEEALKQVLEQAEGLCDGQRNWVCRALDASLTASSLPPPPCCAAPWPHITRLDLGHGGGVEELDETNEMLMTLCVLYRSREWKPSRH